VQILDGFDWWGDELRAILGSLATKYGPARPSGWVIAIADDGIRVQLAGAPEFQSRPLDLDASVDEIAALLTAKHPSVAVRIESSLALTRRLATHRLPARQARSMAELDLLASTPLDLSHVHILRTALPEQGCSYHVVKTKTLSSVLDAVRSTGGTVRSIAIVEQGQAKPVDRLSCAAVWPPTRRERIWKQAWLAASVAVVLGLAATWAHAHWRYWQAGAELDEQIAGAQMQARKARAVLQKRQTELEQTDRIRAEKKSAVSTVRVLAELTRLLPDGAWVTDISSKKGELTVTGFAASAADLIQPIDASPLFSSPEFAAPVVKVPGQAGERFTITARIDAP